MKNFSTSINNLVYLLKCGLVKDLSISTSGELDCGNKFEIDIRLSLDGKITSFNIHNRGDETLDFYKELHEPISKINNIQSMINWIKKQISKETPNYRNEILLIEEKIKNIDNKKRNLEIEINKTTNQYRKATGQDKLNIETDLNAKKEELSKEITHAYSLECEINKIEKRYTEKINNYLNTNI